MLSGPWASDPLTALVPDQAPPAAQAVAFWDDQVRVTAPLAATDVALAASLAVGAGAEGVDPETVTVTAALVEPPAPEHCKVNVLSAASVADCIVPDDAWLPAQAPDAMQPVAFWLDQLNVVVPPLLTDVGLA